MTIAILLIGLLFISFLWALWSLKKETSNTKEIEHTKKDLMREKILFKS